MLNAKKRVKLARLAEADLAYTKGIPYPSAIANFIEACYEARKMNTYLILMTEGLGEIEDSTEYKNALQVCRMFNELYRNNNKIRESINATLEKQPNAIEQLKTAHLSTVLTGICTFSQIKPLSIPQKFTFQSAPDSKTETTTTHTFNNANA